MQNNGYSYDLLGNLTQRVDPLLTENFSYDSLNRLFSSSGSGLVTKVYDYDAIGNITYKSDVGVYTYGTKPHAVASISGTVNATFSYDSNGNLTSGNGRTLTHTSFNIPATITGNGYTYTYTYNSEHQRVRLVHSTLGTFVYLHPGGGELLYEKEIRPGGLIEHKHYINGGSGLVGVYLTRSDSTTEMRYYLKDHLRSIQVITTNTGAVLETLAYDAFGKRRSPTGADDPNNTLSSAYTDRGFTGHEHLDEIALIHMNGRIYDPLLARFMTPDPLVNDPRNLQDFNRYSYAVNNPLKFLDPTGYTLVIVKVISGPNINESLKGISLDWRLLDGYGPNDGSGQPDNGTGQNAAAGGTGPNDAGQSPSSNSGSQIPPPAVQPGQSTQPDGPASATQGNEPTSAQPVQPARGPAIPALAQADDLNSRSGPIDQTGRTIRPNPIEGPIPGKERLVDRILDHLFDDILGHRTGISGIVGLTRFSGRLSAWVTSARDT